MQNIIAGAAALLVLSPAIAAAETGDAAGINARAPVLIEFDGINLLARAASRQRILSQSLTFRVDVDAQGVPTDCETARRFRRAATQIDLCRPILNYSTFEPALDAAGNPVAGRFEMHIDYNSLIARRGPPATKPDE